MGEPVDFARLRLGEDGGEYALDDSASCRAAAAARHEALSSRAYSPPSSPRRRRAKSTGSPMYPL